ncbi:hypothetical protein [Desulfocastanea catecholica]
MILLALLLLGLTISPPSLIGGAELNGQAGHTTANRSSLFASSSTRLIGTAVGKDPANNFAIPEDGTSSQQWMYREGELIDERHCFSA